VQSIDINIRLGFSEVKGKRNIYKFSHNYLFILGEPCAIEYNCNK
jgi:hypothetical protein